MGLSSGQHTLPVHSGTKRRNDQSTVVTCNAAQTATYFEELAIRQWNEGCWIEATDTAAHAVAANPELETAGLILGVGLSKQGEYERAGLVLDAVTRRYPRCTRAWHNLGNILSIQREYVCAEFCLRKALELEPLERDIQRDLADLLSLRCRTEEAKALLQPFVAKGDPLAALRTIQLFSPIPASNSQIDAERTSADSEIRRLLPRMQSHSGFGDNAFTTNFPLAYHGRNDRRLNESWAKLVLKTWPALGTSYAKSRPASGRLKVGFISAHLSMGHTIAKLNTGLMATLPRDRFEVVAIDVGGSPDPPFLNLFADKVVRVPLDQRDARQLIAAENLDVAFFPDIGMNACAWGLALSRYAPVQCTTWGHPVTTGMSSIDYFLSSDLIEPPNADDHYSEKLMRLATLSTVYRRPHRDSKRIPQFPADWHVYTCAQSIFKCHPEFDAVWASIVRSDQQGRLVFISFGPDYDKLFLHRLSTAHPDIMDRVIILDRMSEYDFLGLQMASHVLLDTWPFGGGSTHYEAFAYGTPVVTMPGEFMRGRVALGLYTKMGFTELIANSSADYVAKAIRVASDPAYRRWVREEILSRNHLIFDDEAATREVAAFFEAACAAAGR